MLFYAVAILPLIESLSDGTIQSWYADDSSCVANLKDLRVWFDKLCDLGPDYGYYPEPSKSFLVIDEENRQGIPCGFVSTLHITTSGLSPTLWFIQCQVL